MGYDLPFTRRADGKTDQTKDSPMNDPIGQIKIQAKVNANVLADFRLHVRNIGGFYRDSDDNGMFTYTVWYSIPNNWNQEQYQTRLNQLFEDKVEIESFKLA